MLGFLDELLDFRVEVEQCRVALRTQQLEGFGQNIKVVTVVVLHGLLRL